MNIVRLGPLSFLFLMILGIIFQLFVKCILIMQYIKPKAKLNSVFNSI